MELMEETRAKGGRGYAAAFLGVGFIEDVAIGGSWGASHCKVYKYCVSRTLFICYHYKSVLKVVDSSPLSELMVKFLGLNDF